MSGHRYMCPIVHHPSRLSLSDRGHSHPTLAADGKHDKNVVQLPQMLAGAVHT